MTEERKQQILKRFKELKKHFVLHPFEMDELWGLKYECENAGLLELANEMNCVYMFSYHAEND